MRSAFRQAQVGPNRDSLAHHYILGYERYILAVVDWIENTIIPSFFIHFSAVLYVKCKYILKEKELKYKIYTGNIGVIS